MTNHATRTAKNLSTPRNYLNQRKFVIFMGTATDNILISVFIIRVNTTLNTVHSSVSTRCCGHLQVQLK